MPKDTNDTDYKVSQDMEKATVWLQKLYPDGIIPKPSRPVVLSSGGF